jgi:outer membrane murein-binding lipoprotein Lpp
MKTPIVVKMAAVIAVAGLAGCTDLKPMQAQIDNLKTQVQALYLQVIGAPNRKKKRRALRGVFFRLETDL